MSLPRQKFREMVLQLLYSHNKSDATEKEITSFFMEKLRVTKNSVKEAIAYKSCVYDKIDEIDEKIKMTSFSYKIERISLVELNILRLGFYEILYNEKIPKKIAIAEAIRLCKKFATTNSVSFVNAILDSEK
jgi:transcription antitermination protein NusB